MKIFTIGEVSTLNPVVQKGVKIDYRYNFTTKTCTYELLNQGVILSDELCKDLGLKKHPEGLCASMGIEKMPPVDDIEIVCKGPLGTWAYPNFDDSMATILVRAYPIYGLDLDKKDCIIGSNSIFNGDTRQFLSHTVDFKSIIHDVTFIDDDLHIESKKYDFEILTTTM